jgi:hypothetical protein
MGKTVDLTIPKTSLKLKQEIINRLYDQAMIDQPVVPIYENEKFIQQVIRYEKTKNMEEVPVKIIGLWMSGGADSSLLAYLLCKTIRDENLDVKFQPISVRRGRPNNPIYAEGVVDFICEDLDIDFILPHEIYYPPLEDSEMTEIKIFWERDAINFREKKFQVLYSGITSNPPNSAGLPKNKERTRDEESDKPVVSRNGLKHYINPFFNINKKWEAEVYKDFGLLDTLFPITYSCEGDAEDTKTHTWHCGNTLSVENQCWWCIERKWAFGRLQ